MQTRGDGGLDSSPLRRNTPERFLLILLVAWILVLSLAPFSGSFALPDSVGTQNILETNLTDGLFDRVIHFVSFFLLGSLIALVHSNTVEKLRSLCLFLLAAIGCFALEAIKFLNPSRHAALLDFMINVLGVSAGLWVLTRCHFSRRWRLVLREKITTSWPYLAGGVLVSASLIWWAAGLYPAMGSIRMDWEKNFKLMIGNESDNSRPWLGEIEYVAIYQRAFTSRQVIGLYRNRTTTGKVSNATSSDRLVAYDFRMGPRIFVSPGNSNAGPLTIGKPSDLMSLPSGGMLLKSPSLLITAKAASSMTDAIMRSDAFSVEAWIKPANLIQAGPARIVSLSRGTGDRNFTLGQAGPDLVFRVRNKLTGPNGYPIELKAEGVLDQGMQHIVAVYDHGVSLLYKDGAKRAEMDLREPARYTRVGTGTAGNAACAVLLVVNIALPAVSLFYHLGKESVLHIHVVTLTFLLGCGPFLISCLIVGGPWRMNFLMWLAGALLVVYPLGVRYGLSFTPRLVSGGN